MTFNPAVGQISASVRTAGRVNDEITLLVVALVYMYIGEEEKRVGNGVKGKG